ncbi:aminotransferase class IV [Amorphus orientalis]|uniref:Branched-chain-amino-acid aminotransferase n=1 Tax=Amorphus orientalis TaxID=649198 RepID=A0AAE4ASA4_9HYPH|nr:aminotransferase class IV [Amorphus orientalis]MDQ0314907.1 branched-chain amino acid aminotransferase [Amorphus orientalis]
MKRTIWLPHVAVSPFYEGEEGYRPPQLSGNEINSAVQLSADAIQFGFCVYEGMRAYMDGAQYLVFRARDHHARLARSCEALGLPCPEFALFIDAIKLAILENRDPEQKCLYLRPIVFSASGGIMPEQGGTYVFAVFCTEMGVSNRDIRVLVETESPRTVPAFSEVKTATNYTSSALINQKALNDGFDTVLWLDPDGFVRECTTMNVFMHFDGRVITPGTNGILSGITRKTMIGLLAKEGEQVIETDVHIDDVVNGLETGALSYMFTTSTALGINKVTAVRHGGTEYRIEGNGPAGLGAAIGEHRNVTRQFAAGLAGHSEIRERSYVGAI